MMNGTIDTTSAYKINHAPEQAKWDGFVNNHVDAHLLQTSGWGKLKSAFGWSAEQVAIESKSSGEIVSGALLLFRRLPLQLGTMIYVPAGPLFYGNDPAHPANEMLWRGIDEAAKRHRAIFLKAEPCNWYRPRTDLPAQLTYAGLHMSTQTVQPPRTSVLDLTPTEDAVLKRMNESTRYKSKLAKKKEIDVREGTSADVASFNALMAVTGNRDAFGIHDPAYYQKAFDLFAPQGQCALLIASYAGRDLAGVMTFKCGKNAYYLYGASSNEERNRMPTYIVQWAAMRWAMQQDAERYDLWGVPDADTETLEAEFEQRKTAHDGLWGVYGFKRGFGGQIVRSVGAWDNIYNPILYRLYDLYIRLRRTTE